MNPKNQKIFIVGLFIFLTILAFCIFLYYRLNIVSQDIQTTDNQDAQFAIEDKHITDEAKPLKSEVTYPSIKGSEEFNQAVKKIIDEEVGNFKKIALENDQAVRETDPAGYAAYPRTYELDISYEKATSDKNTISIVFQIYADTGGAHPNGYFRALTFDLQNNKNIILADIFKDQANYLKNISDYSMQDLKKQVTDRMGSTEGFWIEDGAGPMEDNFAVFLLKDSSVTFYFAPYQVAPYSVGSFQVSMPR